jgi:phage shock protein C
METKKLYRSKENKVLAGVFGGLGEYANIDPVLLRLFWVLIVVFTGFIPGLIAYFLAIIIIPKKSEK